MFLRLTETPSVLSIKRYSKVLVVLQPLYHQLQLCDTELEQAHLFHILLIPVEPVGRSFDRFVGLGRGEGEFTGICHQLYTTTSSADIPLSLKNALTRSRSSSVVRELKPNLTTKTLAQIKTDMVETYGNSFPLLRCISWSTRSSACIPARMLDVPCQSCP